MSWDQLWSLPHADYPRARVAAAVDKAIADFPGTTLAPLDPDLAEFAEDFARDEEEAGAFEFSLVIPRRWLTEAGDEPRLERPDYECLMTIAGDDDAGWQVCVSSGEASNRDANLAISAIAARVSVLLGGPEEPEAL